ncbi:hypothetical protein DSS3P1_19 [Ruegeria phage DSS3-P1]|nr:hypothetical protein DSS3P1_19 [Ruegeria phage DSS3-P1]YP_009997236.1 hypothetical protein JT312_gp19 [Ruegeria phage vB_RpoS-V18]YP_009997318.1 hypothetical protein JT313_gp19 [Ruegeria phage vB_RpoS-V11]YP_009997401.1 hypothetical protein JT314_gp20 [Ruegeria phage vB_RpoS-V7]AIT13254.1 hypothetical protein DSS3P1_19 [Ruegeria phage DSS3-P1]AWY08723.1 hypothetical protein vBRpoSV7_20 [Ruegeria phage vB_RpoS-V7]AWY08895.1 hypothetical protein vBRpoSV18_19 [Ruegeria phage vB_RpoS-V18]AWY0
MKSVEQNRSEAHGKAVNIPVAVIDRWEMVQIEETV